jgi:hypothetical protein
MESNKSRVARHVGIQRQGCALLGSPLYAGLLERLEANVLDGGAGWRVLEPFAGWPGDSAYVLRLMGAVNRLALQGEAPELAPHFAPQGNPTTAWPAFEALLRERGDEVQQLALEHPVQTNEVGRAAVLAPAILEASQGMPVRLLELGATAGLNLRWDAFRYEDLWGDPASPVQLRERYADAPPPFEPKQTEVIERSGCDAHPLDPTTDDGRLTLLSYVWPDQAERLSLLRGALTIARDIPAQVDATPAAHWLEGKLAEPLPDGTATVVYHSIFWQYLDDEERTRIRHALNEAGTRATQDARLVWLRMEADGASARVDATLWPGGESRLLARAGYHGRPVEWFGSEGMDKRDGRGDRLAG